jgi:hypothetical protein
MGFLRWCGELVHDMFFVADDHPMTEKEYDRWNAGRILAEFPGRAHTRIREERQHRELIEAIERGKL